MSPPRVAIAVPLYNRAEYLPLALDSLLGQTYREIGLVLVDDRSDDDTPAIAERYAAADERVAFVPNPRHLGLILTWRRAFELALERFPDAEYFAWASDHDLWDARWLEALVGELDRVPEAVLAYPLSVRISERGEVLTEPWRFSTAGIGRPLARLRRTCTGMGGRAGSMIYGLHRRSALEQIRVYRYVREPDNLVLAELSLLGEFRQVPEVLWKRRFPRVETRRRQLASLFQAKPPWYAWLPPWVQHSWPFARRHGAIAGLVFVVFSAGDMVRRWVRSAALAARATSARTAPAPASPEAASRHRP